MNANSTVNFASLLHCKTGINILAKVILNNEPSVTTLDLSDFHISEVNICRLAAALKNNTILQSITLRGVTEVSARAIGDMLVSNRGLHVLALDCCNAMGSGGFEALMQGLVQNNTLTTISLASITLASISLDRTMHEGSELRYVSDMLEANRTLKHLCLTGNELSRAEDFYKLAASLAINQGLVRLDLNYCELQTFQVEELFKMLEENHSLELLALDCNGIDADIAESFGKLLRCNMTLLSISISHNCVGSRTAAVVAKALLENTSLLTLKMDNNEIDDVGALAFSQDLPLMKGLRELSLHQNTMTSVGGKALIAAMQQSRTLTSLGMQGSAFEFTPRMEHEIEFYKRRNETAWQVLECAPLKETLWPRVLATSSSDPSMLYFFINQSPAMVSQANVRGNDAQGEPNANHNSDLRAPI